MVCAGRCMGVCVGGGGEGSGCVDSRACLGHFSPAHGREDGRRGRVMFRIALHAEAVLVAFGAGLQAQRKRPRAVGNCSCAKDLCV